MELRPDPTLEPESREEQDQIDGVPSIIDPNQEYSKFSLCSRDTTMIFCGTDVYFYSRAIIGVIERSDLAPTLPYPWPHPPLSTPSCLDGVRASSTTRSSFAIIGIARPECGFRYGLAQFGDFLLL
ncbi:hypothetical protein EVAR_82834_1 [Eumeta japonica]|uniref:Uncharacterized protein n=1 Tax=Eumeta variegata TaxID=151549 RepID=A0A4C1V3R5_EUMVA|nr:hypothetical protein EVAR_82834_1 [Eumeta japonica]